MSKRNRDKRDAMPDRGPALERALYGQLLLGPAPYPQGPKRWQRKMDEWRAGRRKRHPGARPTPMEDR